ncbi:uncharacterized protein LOC124357184 [Homalodisca vitripennis]|uniref:uncharacterized protein LOC124357184 n=1 Tax=Homalodisca vitripennis TaxID=197043 RepID=UPI001EEAC2C9|nr:uncharacterized protein LOC124357184 [Homalodisca vitripennis]
MINEQVVEEVLQGQLEASKWAIPRQTKIYICSTRADFLEERRTLLENVGPELQSMYDSTGLEVELVDVHFGTGTDTLQDPYRFADQLAEIQHCHQVSRGCFFLLQFTFLLVQHLEFDAATDLTHVRLEVSKQI